MDYKPELAVINVPLFDLLLDPNNPRFSVRPDEEHPEEQFDDKRLQAQTEAEMASDRHQIKQLKDSIQASGWQPVDRIFVQRRAFPDGEKLIVLEGNRRVTALKELVRTKALDVALLKQVDPLEVVEVLGDAESDVVRAQVTYLLGVRHHGSLTAWGAFAQAHELYERYLRIASQTDDTFEWKQDVAGTWLSCWV